MKSIIETRMKNDNAINILVLDNNIDIQKLIQLSLNRLGCNVSLSDFYSEVLIEKLHFYHIVFISVSPNKKGIDLLHKIRKELKENCLQVKTKFVAYTASGEMMVEKCRKSGFNEVLRLPFMLNDFKLLLAKFRHW